MHIPIFVPDQPYIYRFLWDFARPFAGTSASPHMRNRAPSKVRVGELPGVDTGSPHPYDPLRFLETASQLGRLPDQAYWYRYTEFAVMPALQRFKSVAHLSMMVAGLGEEEAST